jgi:hypothetical protein
MELAWAAFLVFVACIFIGIHETVGLEKRPSLERDSSDEQ